MNKKKISLNWQEVINKHLKDIRNALLDYTSVSTMAQDLKEERSRLLKEKEEGLQQRKLWEGRAAQIRGEMSAASETLNGARPRDSRPPTTPQRGTCSMDHHISTPPTPTPRPRSSPRSSRLNSIPPPDFGTLDGENSCMDEIISHSEGELDPRLVPFDPSPRKLAIINAFELLHPGINYNLTEEELDSMLSTL